MNNGVIIDSWYYTGCNKQWVLGSSCSLTRTTRQTKADDRLKMSQNLKNVTIRYLVSPSKMHLRKYKYAWYWFSNSWNSLWNFENFDKIKTILNGKTNVNIKFVEPWIKINVHIPQLKFTSSINYLIESIHVLVYSHLFWMPYCSECHYKNEKYF